MVAPAASGDRSLWAVGNSMSLLVSPVLDGSVFLQLLISLWVTLSSWFGSNSPSKTLVPVSGITSPTTEIPTVFSVDVLVFSQKPMSCESMELCTYFTDEETRLTDTERLAQEHRVRWWYSRDTNHICLLPKLMHWTLSSSYPVTSMGLFYWGHLGAWQWGLPPLCCVRVILLDSLLEYYRTYFLQDACFLALLI